MINLRQTIWEFGRRPGQQAARQHCISTFCTLNVNSLCRMEIFKQTFESVKMEQLDRKLPHTMYVPFCRLPSVLFEM